MQTVSKLLWKKRILSSSNASKATYFAKVGKNIHSNLLVQTKLSWKHLTCFHFSTAGCKNTSKTKMLLKRCLVFQLGCSGLKYKLLLWFQTSLTQTSQLKNDVILYDIFCAVQVQPNASKWPLVQRKREFQLRPCHSAWNDLLCTTISVLVTNKLC